MKVYAYWFGSILPPNFPCAYPYERGNDLFIYFLNHHKSFNFLVWNLQVCMFEKFCFMGTNDYWVSIFEGILWHFWCFFCSKSPYFCPYSIVFGAMASHFPCPCTHKQGREYCSHHLNFLLKSHRAINWHFFSNKKAFCSKNKWHCCLIKALLSQ